MRLIRRGAPALLLALSALVFAGAGTAETVEPETRDEMIRTVHDLSDVNELRLDEAGEAWVAEMSKRLERRIEDEAFRLHLLRHVYIEADKAGLLPELVLALIEVESNFNRWAISSAGARGLMQIMPFWIKEIGREDDNLFDVATNLRFGCTILRYYLDIAKGDLTEALARYNGSYGQLWYPSRVYVAFDRRWYRE